MPHDATKTATIKKTALYDIHIALGAKMVEFAGYWMPVQYRGIIEEHRQVRSAVGVFDVSHMGEFECRGKAAAEFLQRMTINDISKLQEFQAQYSALCYPDGGIVDDLIVYRWPDRYMMVVNASNIDKDFSWLAQHATPDVGLVNISDEIALLAVQGRYAQPTLQQIVNINLANIKYYWFASGEIAGVPAFISRTGYTGEDGFEVGFAAQHSEKVWNAIFEAGKEFGIEPIGLGARDTLRLEMKYCLYGNDIDQTTNPLEAGLGWITKLDKSDFIGRDAIAKIKAAGLQRKLVGFELEGKNIARHGYPILKDGAPVGHVTSGTFSPSLEKSIGLGYVALEFATIGTELTIDIRGRLAKAQVVKTPFHQRPYPSNRPYLRPGLEKSRIDAYDEAHAQFEREEQAYWAMRDALMKDYYGMWVAVANGQVVAVGKNDGRVGYEAYLKTGGKVSFCAQVGFEDRVYRIRQLAAGYHDINYFPPLPKIGILTSAIDKNISTNVEYLVDTGADLTLLRNEIADQLGLRRLPLRPVKVSGIGGIPERRQLFGAIVHLAGTTIPISVDCRDDIDEDILGRNVINEFELTVCAKRDLVRFQWIEGDGAEQ